jgi:alpha-L-fucosidase
MRTITTTLPRLAIAAGLVVVGTSANAQFEPKWESLSRHEAAPEWFQDAKLGIYFHWGVYSVPAFGSEWYPRNMHVKGSREHAHHLETYGDPVEYGYDKFVPQFAAENFDADEWAALFRQAGARFAGPVAEHHDGFSMWASKATPWNAAERGPRRDILGELAAAIRKQDMRLIATFHHARNNLWLKDGQWTGHYDRVKLDFPAALDEAERAVLYGYMPRDKFLALWLDKLKEVVDGYRPDIVWFDSWLDEVPEAIRQEFCAYYLNAGRQWGREVVIVRKQDDLPIEFTVLDHEKSRESGMSPRVWMTDDTISTGSWCYTQDLKIKSSAQVIHSLIDTVAKNGVVLLNISPKADGVIPDDQQQVLKELGQWLDRFGAAIYQTRPWLTYGEGPTREPEGGFSASGRFLQLAYSAGDVRYTRSKDGKTVYAIVMGWPGAGKEIALKSFAAGEAGAGILVLHASLVGSDVPLAWRREEGGLVVTTGQHAPDERAFAIELTVE